MTFTKNMKRLGCRLSAISLCLLIEGCATPPPNVPVFEDLQPHMGMNPVTGHTELRASPACMKAIGEFECGHGVYLLSKQEIYVGENPKTWYNKKSWSRLKRESVIVPAQESYAPLAVYMINACEQMNCMDEVTRYRIRLDELKGIQDVLGPALPPPINISHP